MALKKSPVMKQVSNPIQKPSKKKGKKSGSIGHITGPAPKVRMKKVTAADLREAQDMNLMVAIELRRQSDASIFAMEIEEGQNFYPYSVLTRLLVGWETVGHVSSFDMKITPSYPLPVMTIRFVEALTPEQVGALEPGIRASIEANIAKVRQFPFIVVESPLLAPPKGA